MAPQDGEYVMHLCLSGDRVNVFERIGGNVVDFCPANNLVCQKRDETTSFYLVVVHVLKGVVLWKCTLANTLQADKFVPFILAPRHRITQVPADLNVVKERVGIEEYHRIVTLQPKAGAHHVPAEGVHVFKQETVDGHQCQFLFRTERGMADHQPR